MKNAFFILSVIIGACSNDPAPQSVVLIIEVVDHNERPVPGTDVTIDGASIGATDESGHFQTRLSGPEGRRVHVQISCPDRWIAEDGETRDLSVRFLKRLDPRESAMAPMDARFKCVYRTRRIVLLVRTDQVPNLPVFALGAQIAATDAEGVAQAVLEGVPGDEIEVTLNTSENPELRPAMPSRRLTVPKTNQIIVFDQKFEKQQKNKLKRQRRKRGGPRRI